LRLIVEMVGRKYTATTSARRL